MLCCARFVLVRVSVFQANLLSTEVLCRSTSVTRLIAGVLSAITMRYHKFYAVMPVHCDSSGFLYAVVLLHCDSSVIPLDSSALINHLLRFKGKFSSVME